MEKELYDLVIIRYILYKYFDLYIKNGFHFENDEDYEFFIREENIQPNRELNYVAVVTDIMSRLNVDTAEASIIFNRVNNRYKEFDVKIPSDEP